VGARGLKKDYKRVGERVNGRNHVPKKKWGRGPGEPNKFSPPGVFVKKKKKAYFIANTGNAGKRRVYAPHQNPRYALAKYLLKKKSGGGLVGTPLWRDLGENQSGGDKIFHLGREDSTKKCYIKGDHTFMGNQKQGRDQYRNQSGLKGLGGQ